MLERENRYAWLDALKGLGILLIVFIHAEISINEAFFNWVVPAFFVFAGYTYKNKGSFRSFIRKKSERLLFPYFVYSFALVVADTFFSIFYYKDSTLRLLVTRIFGIFYSRVYVGTGSKLGPMLFRSNNPLWFVTALFVSYLLFRLFFIVGKRAKIPLAIVYFVITVFCTKLPILLPWGIDVSFAGALFMLFGYWMRGYRILYKERLALFAFMILSLAIYLWLSDFNGFMGMYSRIYGTRGVKSVPVSFVMSMAGSLSFMICFKLIEESGIVKILSVVGKNSMSILFVHFFFVDTVAGILLAEKFSSSLAYGYGKFVFGGILTLLYVVIIRKGEKRFPILKLL